MHGNHSYLDYVRGFHWRHRCGASDQAAGEAANLVEALKRLSAGRHLPRVDRWIGERVVEENPCEENER